MKKEGKIGRMNSEEFKELVLNSKSHAEVLRKLKLSNSGSSLKILKKRIEAEDIKTTFCLKSIGLTNLSKKKKPITYYLTENSTYSRTYLKKRLISEGFLELKCYICSLEATWYSLPLGLELDHINGKNDDNSIQNLRLLCPNCHTQTKTFRGKIEHERQSKNESSCNPIADILSTKKKTNKTGKYAKVVWNLSSAEFKELVLGSESYADVLRKIGLPFNRNEALKDRVKEEDIDVSFYREIALSKLRKVHYKARPIEELLVVDSKTPNEHLKKRLIKEYVLENKCHICSLKPYWNNKILILQLDHINGINNDNRLFNLRLLCPNCHTQTPTYGRKNSKTKKSLLLSKPKKERVYKRKTSWPSKEELSELIKTVPLTTIGKKFGVSDNAVRKWCKFYGLPCKKKDIKVYFMQKT